ncbi:hypothetical protein ThidrDRAFT_1131 [Thiorhodococcus drewsii AZ1]|uniref:Uncharacterized protein n=1 Tax=Thiorhodococcus drewsii AZ1 TaxID=765913 RepID=G2DYL9_9GAMM|nr:conjugative transfer protein MobI(A/C) [Thiorhodococcus drewsii]EGV32646.1 hypothetical protein ThidrDRAFT_1131 [Thiorhodococcus drewsii AZ1]
MFERTTDETFDWDLDDGAQPEGGNPLAAVESACLVILDPLHAEAVQLATGFMEAMLRAREAHPYRERGSIGVRVRRSPSPRSAPGVFLIEWFRVRGRHRTDYIARGAGHRYTLRAFGRIEPWERELIEIYEPRFAEIRALLYQIGILRRQARQLAGALECWQGAAGAPSLTGGA